MAAGLFSRFRDLLSTQRTRPQPYSEQGVGGFTVSGGYVQVPETNLAVSGANRWNTAADLLTNISIIASSVRYTLNLIARPTWKADPPSDKPEAKAMAEFVEEVINGVDTSWSRVIRRSAIYRYHGFNLQEWVAKKRDDGKIGIQSIEPRPVHTITKWDVDENGGVLGVVQSSPQTGQEIYLPRQKLVYLVDDALTDRPDGMGWFRHLADPAQRLRRYLKLETMGFERDLAGIPVGRAPIMRINQLVKEGKLKAEEAAEMINALKEFVALKAKEPSTGLVLDSEPFRAKSDTGETISNVMLWGLELLTGDPSSLEALDKAISRLEFDMALIMGTESMLVGREGQGSRALSEDKSRNIYLTSNSALGDMAEAYDRDIVTALWTMNGFPDELRPKLRTEDVAFKDAEAIAKALGDMAAAGAVLHPNDPAINDLRDLMGVSHALELDDATVDLMLGVPQLDPNKTEPGRPSRENPDKGGGGGGPGSGPKSGRGQAKKYDPDQPRDEDGKWTAALSTYAGEDPYTNAIGLNGKLRAGLGLTDEEAATIEGVNEALAAQPPLKEPMTLYRGVAEPVHAEAATIPHPISTTTDIAVADEFATGTGGSHPMVYAIEVPKGARALDMKPYLPDGMRYQSEMLLEAGGKLEPIKGPGGQSNGVVYRRLRYIPPKRES